MRIGWDARLHGIASGLQVGALLAAGLMRCAGAQEMVKPVVSLCSVAFDKGAGMPISSGGKACLDDVALNLQKSPDANLALIGNARTAEKSGAMLAARRAAKVKTYLVKEKGIDARRITLYRGRQDLVTVAVDLIPAHATLDTAAMEAVNESKLK